MFRKNLFVLCCILFCSWLSVNTQAQSFEPLTIQFINTGATSCGAQVAIATKNENCEPNSIETAGIPPSNGWKFTWTSPCCRPNSIDNVTVNVGSGPVLCEFSACGDPTPNGQAIGEDCSGNPITIAWETVETNFVRITVQ